MLISQYLPETVKMGYFSWEEFQHSLGTIVELDEKVRLPGPECRNHPLMQMYARDMSGSGVLTIIQVETCYEEPDACYFDVDSKTLN